MLTSNYLEHPETIDMEVNMDVNGEHENYNVGTTMINHLLVITIDSWYAYHSQMGGLLVIPELSYIYVMIHMYIYIYIHLSV